MNNIGYEEALVKYGKIVCPNKGISMLPLIRQGKDLMVIEKKTEPPKKYDAVLYRQTGGRLALHRVVKVQENGYVICGDNCEAKEYGITEDDILGILTSVIRKGKPLEATSRRYRFYARLVVDFLPVRVFFLKGFRKIKRGCRKIASLFQKS